MVACAPLIVLPLSVEGFHEARFKPTDTADNIADVLVGMFSPSKAESIARSVLAKLKARTKPAKGKAKGKSPESPSTSLPWRDDVLEGAKATADVDGAFYVVIKDTSAGQQFYSAYVAKDYDDAATYTGEKFWLGDEFESIPDAKSACFEHFTKPGGE